VKVVHIELINSHGMSLDSTSLTIVDGELDEEGKINKAMIAFIMQVVINTGDSVRVTEYTG
jgi:hypothetical protein